MKTIIFSFFISSLFAFNLQAWDWATATKIVKHLNDKNFNIEHYTKNNHKENIQDTTNIINNTILDANSKIFLSKYFNKNECSTILDNRGFFKNCYDYDLKGAKYIFIQLKGNLVNLNNLKKRPHFYPDLNIPKKYRTYTKDYTHSGFDRGHSGANDASNDYSVKSQKMTYVMSNIVPQYPKTNRKSYLKVEKYERKLAKNLGYINSLTINKYTNNPKRIGRSKLAVPSGFFKIYWNNDKKFKKCFYIPNDNKIYSLKEMNIDCSKVK